MTSAFIDTSADIVVIASLLILIVLLLLVVWELRELRRLLQHVLSSNRDNLRAVMAEIHEATALLSRTLKSQSNSPRTPKSEQSSKKSRPADGEGAQ